MWRRRNVTAAQHRVSARAFRRASPLPSAIAALLLAAPAYAAPPVPAQDQGAEVVKAIGRCRALADGGQRLACYDRTAGALVEAQTAGDVVVVDRAQIKAVRRQAFGLRLPSIDLLPHTRGDAPLDHLDFKVAAASLGGSGWVLSTDEGSQWVQTDGQELAEPPHAGSRLAVRSGALGSFFCKVDGQSAVRCRRAS